MRDAKCTEDALNVREAYNTNMRSLNDVCFAVVIVYVLLLITLFYTYRDDVSIIGELVHFLGGAIVLLFVSIILIWYRKIYKASVKGLSEIKSSENYVLYLRGFAKDDYDNSRLLNIFTYAFKRFFNDDKFMEEDLARAVKRKRPFYAIGMTKEVFSPVGATRVYVDDKNWKEGALKLIKESTYIVILLDTRESCLWEILQCKDIKDKVLCICENLAHPTNPVDRGIHF